MGNRMKVCLGIYLIVVCSLEFEHRPHQDWLSHVTEDSVYYDDIKCLCK